MGRRGRAGGFEEVEHLAVARQATGSFSRIVSAGSRAETTSANFSANAGRPPATAPSSTRCGARDHSRAARDAAGLTRSATGP